jgi:hypothetical protein
VKRFTNAAFHSVPPLHEPRQGSFTVQQKKTAGVGVGIAGFRADLAVIDDPVCSREDADSQAVRDRTWHWYKTDLVTRLRPRGRVVLI